MKLSIVIPTYNGANKIINLLQSIDFQTFKDFEVIVVIDGSTDTTTKILRGLDYSFKLTIIDQLNTGRAGSRNAGAIQAKGEILLFLDDDIRIEKETLQQHIDFHTATFDSMLMGSAVEDMKLMQTDFQKYKAYLSRIWQPKVTSNLLDTKTVFLMAAHLSLPKSTFLKLGMFNPKLTDAEDYDLALKAINQHIKIYYNNEIVGWHDDFVTCKTFIRRQLQYQTAHNFLKTINPLSPTNDPFQLKKNKVFGSLIYLILSFPLFALLVDEFNIFVLLPKKIRYKIYSAIVHSRLVALK